ncbi:MAG: 6-phosphofructokinase [Verrucomicrobiales bacterium]|nr:ATP-dependent 6-phosphofructokinase [Verrucomicrobiota bacterium JB025]
MAQHIGVLTAGGDCPGLNATIRGLGKAAREQFGMRVTGFLNGFRGLALDQTVDLDDQMLSGILTNGGTILGTSRDKPHKINIGGKQMDMTDAICDCYRKHHLDALVCIGGGGTQKNARRLMDAGLNVVTLPKTIDNDIWLTERTFGFDTALEIATEAIDRLHSTATSHERVIVVEIMGHRAGWLALEAGIAGGADVILIPEIPYDIEKVAEAIRQRTLSGKRFSIIAVAEGAMSVEDASAIGTMVEAKAAAESKKERQEISTRLRAYHKEHLGHTIRITEQLEQLTGQETRLTILGHLQRGGTPTASDRVFATWLGTECARVLDDKHYGIMLAYQGGKIKRVPLEDVAGTVRLVPHDTPLITAARGVGVCFGD